jgi:O-antigen ligase
MLQCRNREEKSVVQRNEGYSMNQAGEFNLQQGKHNLLKFGVEEQLRDHIWPRNFSFWVALGYLALIIIRPWEVLFPWMSIVHFERLYVIFMLVVVFLDSRKQPVVSFQTGTVLTFCLALILCCLTAYNTVLAWDEFYIYLALILFYLVLLMVIRSPYTLTFTVAFYIFVMTLYLGKSQWEFWVHGQHRYDMGVVRLVGIESSYGGPNALAMSIVVSMPFALFLWRHRKEFVASWPGKWAKRYFLLLKVYGVLALCSLVMTNSRSGIVSFVFFLMLLFVSKRGLFKKIGYVLLGIILLTVVWQVLPEENKGRIRTIWAPEEGPANAQVSADGRVEGFKAGMEMFYRHPATGVGLGNFVEYRVNNLDGIALQPHNLAGQILGELGLVGAISFLFMVFAILGSCRRMKQMAKAGMKDPDFWVDFATACRNSVLLLFFTGLFGHNMLRYNWLWAAAFAMKGAYFLKNAQSAVEPEVSCADR